ncbi:Nn.00g074510.m01.CDS01 [Neocucurbitaria sp. VM-36]
MTTPNPNFSATPTTTPQDPALLPPDVSAARRTRINNDLIMLFSRPCPSNSKATAQGIGLYTHAGIPNPHFSPIGGPRRVGRKKGGVEAPMDEGVKSLWREVRDVVDEEEKVLEGTGDVSLEGLRGRYGGLDGGEGGVGGEIQLDVDLQQSASGQSLGGVGSGKEGGAVGGDITMSGVEVERRGRSPVKRGNTYDPVRDPRKQGR